MALVAKRGIFSSRAAGEAAGLPLVFKRWATKKAGGSTQNNRDSNPKNLGVKKFGGEHVIPGNIIIRQRGTKYHPGDFVGKGKDFTLFALIEGNVKFEKNPLSKRQWVHVIPKDGPPLHPLFRNMKTPAEPLASSLAGSHQAQDQASEQS